MFFGLFENYTATSSPSSNKGKFFPIVVDYFPIEVINRISSYLKNNNFYNILVNEEYYDIYGEKRGFEYSIQAVRSDNRTLVSLSVFGEHKRGRTRGEFKRFYSEINKILS